MRVLFGEAPRLVNDVIVMRHHVELLLMLVPHGLPWWDAVQRYVSLVTPEERDTVRMAAGAPPVGFGDEDIAYPDGDTWCPRRLPEALLLHPPTCDCAVDVSRPEIRRRSPVALPPSPLG